MSRPGAVPDRTDLAILAATSGHSGVDRVIGNLLPGLCAAGLRVALLRIEGHGPYLGALPSGATEVPLGRRHVNSSLLPLARYLGRARPRALLTDKDRVNRVALLAAWLARSSVAVSVRLGTTVSVNLASRGRWERWLQTQSIRRLYPRAHAVLVPSLGVREDLVRHYGLAASRVVVVPSPVVSPAVTARAALAPGHPWLAAKPCPVVLGIGELSERKDFATLLRAFARVRQRRPCRLIILGEGRRRAQLEALAAELGIAADLSLPGHVANPYAYLARADVFCLSSRWEGMPVALIEALAVGTPALSTDCPSGPREVLDDGRVGPLVPVGAAEPMAGAILRLLDAPPSPDSLRQAVSRYSVAASTAAYIDALGLAG